MTAAVVVPSWGDGSEEELAVLPLVRALAVRAPVELVVLEGGTASPGLELSGVTITEIAAADADAAARAVARRALALGAAAAGRPASPLPEPARTLLSGPLERYWHQAAQRVAQIDPELVVVCGSDLGGARALSAALGPARCGVLALCDRTADLDADTLDVARGAGARLATSATQHDWLVQQTGATWADVGVAVEPPSVTEEDLPGVLHPFGYVAVVDSLCAGAGWGAAPAGRAGAASRAGAWLAAALAPRAVIALEGDELVSWRDGRAVRRTIDDAARTAVVAFSRVVAAAAPGEVLAWSVLLASAEGRPVVALDGTLGAAHLRESGGGIVARNAAEGLGAVRELVADAEAADVLGRAGAEWATARVGSFERYAAAVSGALADLAR